MGNKKEKNIYRWLMDSKPIVFEYILADSEEDAYSVIRNIMNSSTEKCLYDENLDYLYKDDIELITSVKSPNDVYKFIKTYNIYEDIYLKDELWFKFFGPRYMLDYSLLPEIKNSIQKFESTPIGSYDFG